MAGFRDPSQLGGVGAVEADNPLRLEPRVQRGDIGKTDQRLEGSVSGNRCESGKKAHRAVAAACAEHSLDFRIEQRCVEFCESSRVVPRKIAVSIEETWAQLRAIPRRQQRQAGIKGFAVERPGRGNDGNSVAAGQCRRLAKRAHSALLRGETSVLRAIRIRARLAFSCSRQPERRHPPTIPTSNAIKLNVLSSSANDARCSGSRKEKIFIY